MPDGSAKTIVVVFLFDLSTEREREFFFGLSPPWRRGRGLAITTVDQIDDMKLF